MIALIFLFLSAVHGKVCYWNNRCPYAFYGTKTAYETVRGDIRDYEFPENCEPISVWRLQRHGNRHPTSKIISYMKDVVPLKDEIIASFEAGTSQLCSQDIENFKNWKWKPSLDNEPGYLTKTGYDELYHIGKRFAEKYHRLLRGTPDQFYLRPTNEQRTIASCAAFAHGLTDQVHLNMTIADPWIKDTVIRPYDNCERYLKEIKAGPKVAEEEDHFFNSPEFQRVLENVQVRLGIATNLTAEKVSSIYQLCRYFRTWSANLRSPWCAGFSNEDLVTMEYSDDVSHYYKKGYGSSINVQMGEAPLKDLYDSFEAVVNGKGKKLVAYFSHDTMMEMAYSALGLYYDGAPIEGSRRNPDRLWRTTFFGAFSCNLMAVLNRCKGSQEPYRVQLFINELISPICPPRGCTWQEFQNMFHNYSPADLTICNIPESK